MALPTCCPCNLCPAPLSLHFPQHETMGRVSLFSEVSAWRWSKAHLVFFKERKTHTIHLLGKKEQCNRWDALPWALSHYVHGNSPDRRDPGLCPTHPVTLKIALLHGDISFRLQPSQEHWNAAGTASQAAPCGEGHRPRNICHTPGGQREESPTPAGPEAAQPHGNPSGAAVAPRPAGRAERGGAGAASRGWRPLQAAPGRAPGASAAAARRRQRHRVRRRARGRAGGPPSALPIPAAGTPHAALTLERRRRIEELSRSSRQRLLQSRDRMFSKFTSILQHAVEAVRPPAGLATRRRGSGPGLAAGGPRCAGARSGETEAGLERGQRAAWRGTGLRATRSAPGWVLRPGGAVSCWAGDGVPPGRFCVGNREGGEFGELLRSFLLRPASLS